MTIALGPLGDVDGSPSLSDHNGCFSRAPDFKKHHTVPIPYTHTLSLAFMPPLRSLKAVAPLFRNLSSLPHTRSIVHLKNAPIDFDPEVKDALAHRKPVVALETALVTHGLPYPTSLRVPLELEEIVRSTGAVPATIGIVGGRVKIGLKQEELDRLADRRSKPSKISRRDIAAAIASKADGGMCTKYQPLFLSRIFGQGRHVVQPSYFLL